MNKSNCNIITSSLNNTSRKTKVDDIVSKEQNCLNITYINTDTIDSFESNLSKVCKNSASFYNISKKYPLLYSP